MNPPAVLIAAVTSIEEKRVRRGPKFIRVSLLICAALVGGCARHSDPGTPFIEDPFIREVEGYGDTLHVARTAGVDYRNVVCGCLQRNPASMHVLFWLSSHAGFDGCSGEGNAAVLGTLLRRLGDGFFGYCLRSEPADVQQGVREQILLDFGYGEVTTLAEIQRTWPITFPKDADASLFETEGPAPVYDRSVGKWTNRYSACIDLAGVVVQQFPDCAGDAPRYEGRHPAMILYVFKDGSVNQNSFAPSGGLLEDFWWKAAPDDWIWTRLDEIPLELQQPEPEVVADRLYYFGPEHNVAYEIGAKFNADGGRARLLRLDYAIGDFSLADDDREHWTLGDILVSAEFNGNGRPAYWVVSGPRPVLNAYFWQLMNLNKAGLMFYDFAVSPANVAPSAHWERVEGEPD